jgi:biopolymer transport protein ExbD
MNQLSSFISLIVITSLIGCTNVPKTNQVENHKPPLQESFRSDSPIEVHTPIVTKSESTDQSSLNIFFLKNELYISHKQTKIDFDNLSELKVYIKKHLTEFQELPINFIIQKGVPYEQMEEMIKFLRQNEIYELRFLTLNKN